MNYNAISRKFAAAGLCKYLNVIFDLTNEPIRVIAHSHGCNVVKQASSSSKLNPHVHIGRAVFLACPIFSPMNIAKKDHLIYDKRSVVKKYLYQLQPERFGRIANIYSTRDPVVGNLADKLATSSGWNYEVPEVSFVDQDPNAAVLYENYEMKVPGNIKARPFMDGCTARKWRYTVGLWLETRPIMNSISTIQTFRNDPISPLTNMLNAILAASSENLLKIAA